MNNQFEKMRKLAFGVTNPTQKDKLKGQIKSIILEEIEEAKKKDKDTAPQNDDIELPSPEKDTIEPADHASTDINPIVKSIQELLQKAFAQAKTLGDEKLVTQIGNTITMLVRNQVLGVQQSV